MKRLLIHVLLPIIFITACSSKKLDTADKFELESIGDYLSDIDEFLYEGATESLFKIILDVDGDKKKDMLLSGYYKGGWGNSGGKWTIF